MTTRESLHDLLDEIPDDRLADAERELERLAHGNGNTGAALEDVPIDDEELTDAEVEALGRLARDESDASAYTRDEIGRLIRDATP